MEEVQPAVSTNLLRCSKETAPVRREDTRPRKRIVVEVVCDRGVDDMKGLLMNDKGYPVASIHFVGRLKMRNCCNETIHSIICSPVQFEHIKGIDIGSKG